MGRSRSISFLPALFAAVLLSGCSRPLSTEIFVRSDRAESGVYIFDLELRDSSAVYDFWFYSRTLGPELTGLPLNVQWLAPSGKRFSETVYMKSVDADGERELYRSGVVPAEGGTWRLSVRPLGVDEDFCGLGVICKERHGTR